MGFRENESEVESERASILNCKKRRFKPTEKANEVTEWERVYGKEEKNESK